MLVHQEPNVHHVILDMKLLITDVLHAKLINITYLNIAMIAQLIAKAARTAM